MSQAGLDISIRLQAPFRLMPSDNFDPESEFSLLVVFWTHELQKKMDIPWSYWLVYWDPWNGV